MRRCYFLALFAFGITVSGDAQDEPCNCPGGTTKGKGILYASWGYNRDWFTTSDLHFQNSGTDNYDFTLYDVKATDRPQFNEIIRTAIQGDFSIPQYVYRVGYYFNKDRNLGVELNFDHSKYLMVQDQLVRIKGHIRGTQLDGDTVLYSHFLQFEHTNGANFLIGNIIKQKKIFMSNSRKHWLSIVIKAGAGIVIPKTDVTLFGTRIDNRFHIAGWIAGAETGLRYDFGHFFAEATMKGVYANYSNVLVIGTGKAHHRFGCFQAILNAGYQFSL